MLATFLSRALKKEDLTVFGEGKGERDYLYAKDAANAIIAAIHKPKTKGVFNIGLGKGTSHRELAETINEVFENPNNIRFLHEYLEDKSIQLMSIDKAKQMLNWEPHWTLKEALFDMKNILINDS